MKGVLQGMHRRKEEDLLLDVLKSLDHSSVRVKSVYDAGERVGRDSYDTPQTWVRVISSACLVLASY